MPRRPRSAGSNKALLLAYGFEHRKAAQAFEQALREDRDCAMCAWGAAYVLGPNINRSREYVDVESLKRAFGFAQQAATIAKRLPAAAVSARDQALIAAMQERYEADPKPVPKAAADGEAGAMCAAAGSPFAGMAAAAHPREQAYARAMAEAYQRWSADTDVPAMYAESLMMLTPWSWYDPKGKTAHGNAAAAIDVLRKALVSAPEHPGLIHFLIHVTEQGPNAAWAEAGADRLEGVAPGLPHLVHMPSHTGVKLLECGGEHHVVPSAPRVGSCIARTPVTDSIRQGHNDLGCSTERKGSPHVLVCTKNQAGCVRRVKQRRVDLEDLARLG